MADMRERRRHIRAVRRLRCAGFVVFGMLLAGCEHANQSSTIDRQEKTLKDPFGYSPDMKNSDMTVSGHGELDKQALKRDVDHVINP